MRCPRCNAPNSTENQHCQQCGEKLPPPPGQPPAEEVLEVLPALPASAEDAGPRRPRPSDEIEVDEKQRHPRVRRQSQEEDEGTDVVLTFIPYKNPQALAAYYCGFFALVPVVGIILAVVAIILGIRGLRYAGANREAKGAAHAITGLILGAMALIWQPLVCFLIWFTYWYLP